jgi:hypothetical protein
VLIVAISGHRLDGCESPVVAGRSLYSVESIDQFWCSMSMLPIRPPLKTDHSTGS